MSVLLIAEHNNKELKAFTLNAVTAASQIDGDVHALIIGNNCKDAAKAASELPPVKKVITVEASYYENFIAENFENWRIITTSGKEIIRQKIISSKSFSTDTQIQSSGSLRLFRNESINSVTALTPIMV